MGTATQAKYWYRNGKGEPGSSWDAYNNSLWTIWLSNKHTRPKERSCVLS